MNRIAIEEEMNHAVVSLGGRRVDEMESVGKSPNFLNADYIFESEDIIVELKAMDGDSFEKSAEWITDLFYEWVERGILPQPEDGKAKYSLADVPFEEAIRAYKKVRATVMDNVKKANNQIKSTREQLGRPNAKGVLLLANGGNTFLELDVALFVIARIFGQERGRNKHYTGIDRVVYFTAKPPTCQRSSRVSARTRRFGSQVRSAGTRRSCRRFLSVCVKHGWLGSNT